MPLTLSGLKAPRNLKPSRLSNLTAAGALDGAFWGMLFGLIFFVPFLGLAMGAAMGALAGHFADYGIDDKMINEMRDKITEGTSALFLLTTDAVVDKLADALKGTKFEVISSSLSKEEEDKLARRVRGLSHRCALRSVGAQFRGSMIRIRLVLLPEDRRLVGYVAEG